MNLLLISGDPYFQNPHSEVSERHRHYARLLQEKGGQKIFILARYSGQKVVEWEDAFLKVRLIPQRFVLPGLFYFFKAARDWAKKDSIDLISAQVPWIDGALALILSKLWKIPWIGQIHFDLFAREWAQEAWPNPLKRWCSRRILAQASQVRVVSPYLQTKMAKEWNVSLTKLRVLPVAAQAWPKKSEQLRRAKRLLFVGRFSAEKNLDFLLDVFEEVLRRDADYELVMVGEGELGAHLKKRGADPRFQQKIFFTGHLQGTSLQEQFAQAQMLLLTSHHEGHGRVIVEAGLAEVPVLAVKSSGPLELIIPGENGDLVEPQDLAGLVQKILFLGSHPELSTAMGQKGHQLMSERFCPQKNAQAWVDYLVECTP